MKKLLSYILLIPAILLLAGCSNLSEKNTKKKITIENSKFIVEIADSLEEHRQGLAGRSSLDQDKGMLFIFDQKDYPQFWMKDTLIPLQILMIDDCEIVQLIEMAVEEDPANAQMIYKSSKLADKAIELNSRAFDEQIVGKKIKELCD